MKFVVARSANTNRPTCQHVIISNESNSYLTTLVTACGYDLFGTSRNYQDEAIPSIICLRCQKILEP